MKDQSSKVVIRNRHGHSDEEAGDYLTGISDLEVRALGVVVGKVGLNQEMLLVVVGDVGDHADVEAEERRGSEARVATGYDGVAAHGKDSGSRGFANHRFALPVTLWSEPVLSHRLDYWTQDLFVWGERQTGGLVVVKIILSS